MSDSSIRTDVIVIGAGIAGLAASIGLRTAGLEVTCVDPGPIPRRNIGESLDMASPALLDSLDLGAHQLLRDGIATSKVGVKIESLDQASQAESSWLQAPGWCRTYPFLFETKTIHVDRSKLDRKLRDTAILVGVRFVWDRVASVEHRGDRVTRCQTRSGVSLIGKWFIDASGHARVIGRRLGIPVKSLGRRKLCVWGQFDELESPDSRHPGTTIFLTERSDYLEWIWHIPLPDRRASIGWITPASSVKKFLKSGVTLTEQFSDQLNQHSNIAHLVQIEHNATLATCEFTPNLATVSCGDNWIGIGESVSMPDPLTSNGVTSALRHAEEATALIECSANDKSLNPARSAEYHRRVCLMSTAYNNSIEGLVYEPLVHSAFGISTAARAYVILGYFTNAIYSRFTPEHIARAAPIVSLATRTWIAAWWAAARLIRYAKTG